MNQPSPEIAHLCKIDPVMKRVIGEVGPYALSLRARRSPFESLARAIAYQQLHDKAAESILRRFIALFPGRRFPRPADLLAMAEEWEIENASTMRKGEMMFRPRPSFNGSRMMPLSNGWSRCAGSDGGPWRCC